MTYPGPPDQPGQPEPGANPSYPNLPPPGYPAAPPPGYGPQPGYPAAPPPGYGPPPGYPAAPPPGYPPPPDGSAYGPPPKKRRRWPWIVLGTVLVLIVVLVIVGLVFGREGSGNPKEAVDKFWTALVAHDKGKAENYVCSGKNLTDKNNSTFNELVEGLTSYSVGPEAGSGNQRTFPVTVHVDVAGEDSSLIITTTVKKQTGKWYVCDLST